MLSKLFPRWKIRKITRRNGEVEYIVCKRKWLFRYKTVRSCPDEEGAIRFATYENSRQIVSSSNIFIP